MDQDDKVLTEQSNILNEVKNFYVNLYIKNIEQRCNSTNFSNGPKKHANKEKFCQSLIKRENFVKKI